MGGGTTAPKKALLRSMWGWPLLLGMGESRRPRLQVQPGGQTGQKQKGRKAAAQAGRADMTGGGWWGKGGTGRVRVYAGCLLSTVPREESCPSEGAPL